MRRRKSGVNRRLGIKKGRKNSGSKNCKKVKEVKSKKNVNISVKKVEKEKRKRVGEKRKPARQRRTIQKKNHMQECAEMFLA